MATPAADADAARSSFEARFDSQLMRVLELANQHLGMDVSFVAEILDEGQLYRSVHGDAHSFGITTGEATLGYCDLMLAGRIPHAIPATAVDSRVHALRITHDARIGAYIGVPIILSDGSTFGSLGCLSHEAHVLGDRTCGSCSCSPNWWHRKSNAIGSATRLARKSRR